MQIFSSKWILRIFVVKALGLGIFVAASGNLLANIDSHEQVKAPDNLVAAGMAVNGIPTDTQAQMIEYVRKMSAQTTGETLPLTNEEMPAFLASNNAAIIGSVQKNSDWIVNAMIFIAPFVPDEKFQRKVVALKEAKLQLQAAQLQMAPAQSGTN
jgi:hypothetical protein